MTDLAMVTRRTQIGVETTSGTGVSAPVRLRSYEWTAAPQLEVRDFRASGDKYGTTIQPLREFTEFSIDGVLDYNEIIYVLGSLVTIGTATMHGTTAAGTAYSWTFESSNDGADSPATYTLEMGDSDRAQEINYALFDNATFTIEQNVANVTGGGFGQPWVDDITLTGAPSTNELVPMLPSHFKVYVDEVNGDLGTTELDRAFVAEITLADRFGRIWPIDSDNNTGFAGHVELPANLQMRLMVNADEFGLGTLLPNMRAGDTKFVRVEGIGGTTTGGSAFKFTADFAGQIMEAPDPSDREGLYVVQWVLRGVNDATWGKAFSFVVINEMENYT